MLKLTQAWKEVVATVWPASMTTASPGRPDNCKNGDCTVGNFRQKFQFSGGYNFRVLAIGI